MKFTLAVLALIGVLALPAVGLAHPGHEHKIMGTIAAIDGPRVVVKTTDGKERSFEMTPLTKVLRGKAKADARELSVGMRVVVVVTEGAEPPKAKEVQFSAAPARKSQ